MHETNEPPVESKSTEDELRENRIAKMQRFRDRGDEPYKYTFDRSGVIAEALAAFEAAETSAGEGEEPDVPVRVAGRMTAFRSGGKVSFADLRDETGKIQLFLKLDALGEDRYAELKDLDIGDFLGLT